MKEEKYQVYAYREENKAFIETVSFFDGIEAAELFKEYLLDYGYPKATIKKGVNDNGKFKENKNE